MGADTTTIEQSLSRLSVTDQVIQEHKTKVRGRSFLNVSIAHDVDAGELTV